MPCPKITACLRLLVALALLLSQPALATQTLRVFTVNYPLAYFAERISGDRLGDVVEVEFPAPMGVDPAFWMPDLDTIADYQHADLILLNGAGYAKWTQRVSLPRFRLVDSSRGFSERYLQVAGTSSHNHGPTGQHAHAGTAFTTWLDPVQATQQAEAIAVAMARKRPRMSDLFERNLQTLKAELLALDQKLADITAKHPSRPLLASHPIYQYLARRYGLNISSMTWEPDEMPAEAQWAELEQTLTKHPAKWMLWEGEPRQETITRLRQLGVESIVFDPGANRPEQGDFLTIQSRNAMRLERVFR